MTMLCLMIPLMIFNLKRRWRLHHIPLFRLQLAVLECKATPTKTATPLLQQPVGNHNTTTYTSQQYNTTTSTTTLKLNPTRGRLRFSHSSTLNDGCQKNKTLDYSCKDAKVSTVLHACVKVVLGTSCVSMLIARSPELMEMADAIGNVPMTSALVAKRTHVATYLLQKGSDPNHVVYTEKANEDEKTKKEKPTLVETQSCYEFAIRQSFVGVLFAMFQHPKCDLQAALMASISAGGLEWTEQLLLSLDLVDPDFNARLIQLLFKCTSSPDDQQWNKLVSLVTRLIPVSAKSPDVDAATGHTVLHWFIINSFKVSWFKDLMAMFKDPITKRALIRSKTIEGETVLHLAVRLHKKFVIQELLDFDEEETQWLVNEADDNNNTPLHLALTAGKEGVSINTLTTALLISKGASVLIANNDGLSVAKIFGYLPTNQYERFAKALPKGILDGSEIRKIMAQSREQVAKAEEKSAEKRKAAQKQYQTLLKGLQKKMGELDKLRQQSVEQEEAMQAELAMAGRLTIPLDQYHAHTEAYDVYCDPADGTVYDAMLQCTSTNASMYGSNKHHHIQLTVINAEHEKKRVEQAKKSVSNKGASFYEFGLGLAKYRVTETFGRTGSEAFRQNQKKERGHQNLKSALKCFDEAFFVKTKSVIGKDFVIRPTANYYWVKKLYAEKAVVLNEKEREVEQQLLDTVMSREASTFMRLITNLSEVRREMKSLGVDVDSMPLGSTLSRSTLVRAYSVLKKMDSLLTIKEKLSTLQGKAFKEHATATATVKRHLIKLTDQLYQAIPRSFGSYESNNLVMMEMISSKQQLRKEADFLKSLEDVEETLQLVLGGVEVKANLLTRLTGIRELLGVNIRPVVKGSSKYDLITKYCNASMGGVRVHGVVRVTRFEDAIRFAPFEADRRKTDARGLPKNRLLFHSTKISNCVGILARGLAVAPKEAPTTGWMLGKGIYFADTFAKSANYASTRHGYGPTGWGGRDVNDTQSVLDRLKVMFICEVALGEACTNPFKHEVKDLPPIGFDSVFAIGRKVPDPSGDFVTKKGVGLHLGQPTEQTEHEAQLSLSEYVVYDPTRVKIKFVVMYE